MNITRYAQIDYTIRTQFLLFLEKASFTESFLSSEYFWKTRRIVEMITSSNFYFVVDDV